MDGDAIRQLLVELVRAQVVPAEMIERAAIEAEAEGKDQAAHELRCLILRANATRTSEWLKAKSDKRANERRSRLAKIDGGKSAD